MSNTYSCLNVVCRVWGIWMEDRNGWGWSPTTCAWHLNCVAKMNGSQNNLLYFVSRSWHGPPSHPKHHSETINNLQTIYSNHIEYHLATAKAVFDLHWLEIQYSVRFEGHQIHDFCFILCTLWAFSFSLLQAVYFFFSACSSQHQLLIASAIWSTMFSSDKRRSVVFFQVAILCMHVSPSDSFMTGNACLSRTAYPQDMIVQHDSQNLYPCNMRTSFIILLCYRCGPHDDPEIYLLLQAIESRLLQAIESRHSGCGVL